MRRYSLPFRSRLAATLLILAAVSCDRTPQRGEPEEIETAPNEVPAAAQVTAARIADRIGGRADRWYWDTESDDWECSLVGRSRTTELDVGSDGRFAELELIYTFDEIAEALPEIAAEIERLCRGSQGAIIELSLRREDLTDPLPSLGEAWRSSGVVIEFQCPNGRDFEMDARRMTVEQKLDDVGPQ